MIRLLSKLFSFQRYIYNKISSKLVYDICRLIFRIDKKNRKTVYNNIQTRVCNVNKYFNYLFRKRFSNDNVFSIGLSKNTS